MFTYTKWLSVMIVHITFVRYWQLFLVSVIQQE